MTTEFYLKGIYPVEVLSGVQEGLVEVRAKTTFLHTSAYTDGKQSLMTLLVIVFPSLFTDS